jgi:hypothetical protein
MDKTLRNNLRLTVTQCRKLLEDSIAEVLQGQFGLHRDGAVEELSRLGRLDAEDLAIREQLIAHLRHIEAAGFKPAEAAAQLIREVAFTHLNRLCAFKLMEHPERKLIRETIGRGLNSNGFKFYLVEHPDDERHWSSGRQDVAYRHFLVWQGAQLSGEIGVLFAPEDPAKHLFPKQAVLDQVLTLLNDSALADIWGQDETIGWIYQYFTPKELRDKSREESRAPRSSYELAFRNQFFTPRYVVEFLTDNTLGRTWYEMLQGDSVLVERCRYLVRRPNEIFLAPGQQAPTTEAPDKDLSQEELLRQPVYIPHRPRKDPRDLRILDPACGSGHFLLYSFDLLLAIYEEAWSTPDDAPAWFVSGKALHEDYPTLAELRRAAPGLILRHNLYGIDIDLRATQIAGLALWLRAQRAYQEQGLKANERLPITRVNMVCAESMPGEGALLDEFVQELEPAVLGQLVRVVFERMKLAGEAGSLLKIEEELRDAIEAAKRQWKARPRAEQLTLFPEERRAIAEQLTIYDVAQISDEAFWGEAEARVLEALQHYAERAANGQGYRRRLFAGDAARGFAFFDVCQRRYDVVLMNPPFGSPTFSTSNLLQRESAGNVYTAFVLNAINYCHGFIGAITDRSFIAQETFKHYREKIISDSSSVEYVLDLGWGVLDTADVQVAAYTIRKNLNPSHLFMDLRNEDNKEHALGLVENYKWHELTNHELAKLPNNIFAYGLPEVLLRMVDRGRRLSDISSLPRGLGSNKADRTYRVWYEVPFGEIGVNKRWQSLSNGGEFSPFFREDAGVADWTRQDGKLLVIEGYDDGFPAYDQKNYDQYFRSGLSFPNQSTIFNASVLSKDAIPTREGKAIIPNDPNNIWSLLAYLNSSIVRLYVEKTAGLHKQSGTIGTIPVPEIRPPVQVELGRIARSYAEYRRSRLHYDESSRFFFAPYQIIGHASCAEYTFESTLSSIDSILARELALTSETQSLLQEIIPAGNPDFEPSLADMVSYGLGCVFGRWDIRLCLGNTVLPKIPDILEEMPPCPPGTLVAPDGLPATSGRIVSEEWLRARPDAITLPPEESVKQPTIPDEEYPIRIDWDGILVDDPDHEDDIVRRVRAALDVIFGERAEAIEREACQILGVDELRDYFRRPGKGGFWDDHIKRYSKSRRKAPIYWLLQSPKKHYALWLSYHRLDKDTLFKAQVTYVEPKIRLERERLSGMQARRVGLAGRELRQLERAIERQEALISDLEDFRDRLVRTAQRYLEPNHNDGVVLTIAPLWELAPWKEAKQYWNELLAGKYEWSGIGKQLRAKGLVK